LKLLLLGIVLLIIPIALAVEECERVTEPQEVPCLITSAWAYPTCSNVIGQTYNSNGTHVENFTFSDFGESNLCSITWNITTLDSYAIEATNGDSFGIIVEVQNMIAIVLGFITLAAYFGIMGFLTKGWAVKFVSLFLSLIELLVMVAVLYAANAGIEITDLLYINFISMTIIGFAIGMAAFFGMSLRVASPDDELNKPTNLKWDGKSKW